MAKSKVLALHGFRTSSKVLSFQVRDLRTPVLPLEVECIESSILATGPPEPAVTTFFGDGPFYEWWTFDEALGEYTGVEESMERVREHIRTNGPYDGLLGFSQGACLVAMLLREAAQRVDAGEPTTLPGVCFAILCSGFLPRDPMLRERFFEGSDGGSGSVGGAPPCPVAVPVATLHGAKDRLRESSLDLAATLGSRVILEHSGGHEVITRRIDSGDALGKLRSFIADATAAAASPSAS